MENIKHWMDIIIGITILYTSLVEVFLKHSLMDDPDTGNIATSFFKKKFHKFELKSSTLREFIVQKMQEKLD